MKLIKYTAKINFIDNKGKNVELQTQASTASELLKNLQDVLDKKSKNWIMKLFD